MPPESRRLSFAALSLPPIAARPASDWRKCRGVAVLTCGGLPPSKRPCRAVGVATAMGHKRASPPFRLAWPKWAQLCGSPRIVILEELGHHRPQRHRLHRLVEQMMAALARLAQPLRRHVAGHQKGGDRAINHA
jgi:hypothetical protein